MAVDKWTRKKKEESLRNLLLTAKRKAVRRIHDAATGHSGEANTPWNERTFGQMAALELAKGAISEERIKAANAGTTVNVFGAVAIVPRIESHSEWESFHNAAVEGRTVLEVEAVPTPLSEPEGDE